jgi:hypothetical protein
MRNIWKKERKKNCARSSIGKKDKRAYKQFVNFKPLSKKEKKDLKITEIFRKKGST